MASCPIKDATYKIIIKERLVGNHVLWIDKHFFFLSISSLLILNFGIMMGKVKSFKFSECYKFSALEHFFWNALSEAAVNDVLSSAN